MIKIERLFGTWTVGVVADETIPCTKCNGAGYWPRSTPHYTQNLDCDLCFDRRWINEYLLFTEQDMSHERTCGWEFAALATDAYLRGYRITVTSPSETTNQFYRAADILLVKPDVG